MKLLRSDLHDPARWWAVRESNGLISDRWPVDEHSQNQLERMLKADHIVQELAERMDEFTSPELRLAVEQWQLLDAIVKVARPEPGSAQPVTAAQRAHRRRGYRHLSWLRGRTTVTVHRNQEVSAVRGGELVGVLSRVDRGWSATCWCGASTGEAATRVAALEDISAHHREEADRAAGGTR